MAESASPEIVARLKESFEWWNGGQPELMVGDYAEDAELDLSAVFTDMPAYRGHESIRRQVDELWETWEGLRMDSLGVLDVGRGQYVADVRLWGRGKRSGAEVEQRFAFLYTLRDSDGKIIRSQLFPSVQAAMDFATVSGSPTRNR